MTDRQTAIINYLRRCADQGEFPNIREIGDACDISSTSVVHYNLDMLERLGLITRNRGVSRGIRLTEKLAGNPDQTAEIKRLKNELALSQIHVKTLKRELKMLRETVAQ